MKDVKKGETLTEENLRIIRPGYGEKPKYMDDVLGMKVCKDIERGTPFSFELLSKGSILFLTNQPESKVLAQWIQSVEKDKEVCMISNKINLEMIKKLKPYFIVSYNYRHMVPSDVLEYMQGRVVNLDVSMFPYDKENWEDIKNGRCKGFGSDKKADTQGKEEAYAEF